jgi:hypothetical protein
LAQDVRPGVETTPPSNGLYGLPRLLKMVEEIPLVVSEACIPPNPIDPSKLLGLGWTPEVSWRDGFREMCATCFPDLVKD